MRCILNNLRNSTTQMMGDGTPWKGNYITGVDKKYLVVSEINLNGSASNKWTMYSAWSGIFDGNLLQISGLYLDQTSSAWAMFECQESSGDRVLKNIKLNGENYSDAALIGILVGLSNVGYTIENCYVSGTLTTINTLNIAGGMIGRNDGTIKKCVSNVNVQKTSGGLYVGSLAGYNNGVIENCYSTGSVNGVSDVGGLVGRQFTTGTIENCYSIGSVTGTTNIGGLVGTNVNTVTNSYWDTNTSGQLSSAGGVGKTTTEMKTGLIDDPDVDGIYVGWDDTIWDDVDINSYPELIIFE
jgi:hypothetical protein